MSAVQTNPGLKEIDHKSKDSLEKYFPTIWPFVRLMRINRYAEVLMTFWPFTWGFLLAANINPVTFYQTAFYFIMFFLTTFAWVGASCTINDMWDKDIDAKVERCKDRPLASGEISMVQATIFCSFLMIVCVLLTLPLNVFCQKVILSSIIPIILYPLSKRFISCPSMMFGSIVNWGALVGWSAVMKNLQLSVCVPLYVGAICWTVVYDTIYGSQDKKDDAKAGVKSTVLCYGSKTKPLMMLAAMVTISGLVITGTVVNMAWPFYVGMLVAALHLGNQILTINLEDSAACGKMYDSNIVFGFLVFLAMLTGCWNFLQYNAITVTTWHEF